MNNKQYYSQGIYANLLVHDTNLKANSIVMPDGKKSYSVRLIFGDIYTSLYFNAFGDDIKPASKAGWKQVLIKQHQKYKVSIYDVYNKQKSNVELTGNNLLTYISQFNQQDIDKRSIKQQRTEQNNETTVESTPQSGYQKSNW